MTSLPLSIARTIDTSDEGECGKAATHVGTASHD